MSAVATPGKRTDSPDQLSLRLRARPGRPAGRGPTARRRPRATRRRPGRRSRRPAGAALVVGDPVRRPRAAASAASTWSSRSGGGRGSSPACRGRRQDRAVRRPDRWRPRPDAASERIRSIESKYGPSWPSGWATTVVPRPSTVSPVSSACSAGQHERERVGGVAGRRDDPQLETVDVDQLVVDERVARRSRTPGRGRAPGSPAGREVDGHLGVVEVAVGEQHQARRRRSARRARRRGRRRSARGRRRPTGTSPARGAPRCWCRRASSSRGWGEQAARPLAEGAAGPGLGHHGARARPATGRRSSGIDSVQPSPAPRGRACASRPSGRARRRRTSSGRRTARPRAR